MTALMQTVWEYITPGMGGVDTLEALATGGIAYAQSVGVALESRILAVRPAHRPTIAESFRWLSEELTEGRPVAFLNLHKGSVGNLQQWHWVLIVEVELDPIDPDREGDKLTALLYDEGRERRVDLGQWIQTTQKNGGFVSFGEPSL